MTNKDYRELWYEKMEDKPCYRPALPVYDFCLNMDSDRVKRLDCNKCVLKKELHGCIAGGVERL